MESGNPAGNNRAGRGREVLILFVSVRLSPKTLWRARASFGRRAQAIADNRLPHIGVAYRLFPRTDLRAGLGTFCSFWWLPFVRQDDFSSETAMVTSLDGGRTPADLFRRPFPQGLMQPAGESLGLKTLSRQSVQSCDQNRKAIRTLRRNFGIRQEVGPDIVINASYVCNARSDLAVSTSTGHDVRNLNLHPEGSLQRRQYSAPASNRVWFGAPDVNPASANYGKVLSQANSPRNIQLALKVSF